MFGAARFACAAWGMLCGPSDLTSAAGAGNDPQVAQMLAPFDDVVRLIHAAVYGALMVAALVGPGLTAWYYATRRGKLAAYRAAAAPWIVQLQSAGVSV